jgi:hypothetical protein
LFHQEARRRGLVQWLLLQEVFPGKHTFKKKEKNLQTANLYRLENLAQIFDSHFALHFIRNFREGTRRNRVLQHGKRFQKGWWSVIGSVKVEEGGKKQNQTQQRKQANPNRNRTKNKSKQNKNKNKNKNKSNQIKSNQIKSNQIKTNQNKSKQIKSNPIQSNQNQNQNQIKIKSNRIKQTFDNYLVVII